MAVFGRNLNVIFQIVVVVQWLMNVYVYCIPVVVATTDNVNQTQNNDWIWENPIFSKCHQN